MQLLRQSRALERMLEKGRQEQAKGKERGMTVIGSLYHRIREVKSGAVMPWSGYTYSTGE